MSNAKEKLSDLLGYYLPPIDRSRCMPCVNGKCNGMCSECTAELLIANGVTVQEWIPVSERLPEEEEYTAKSKDGAEYYARLLLAYKTDIVEYEIGYYDGYKWLSEMPMRIIKDVIAWKQFEPLPEP